MIPEYTLIRSDRRTLSIEVRRDLSVVVRAPRACSEGEILRFISAREQWLESHIEKQRSRQLNNPEPTAQQQNEFISRAKSLIPERVSYYSEIMDLSPAGVKITGAKTRFGSCSPKNNLCFSWRLMAFPDEAVDYVVVHELAHIVHKNHGREFYYLIASVLPDYKARRELLKNDKR